MNIGFATASGKNVKVSETALEKAKKLFEDIEDKFGTEEADADQATENSRIFDTPSTSTPLRASTGFNRIGERQKAQFKSPAFISPRVAADGASSVRLLNEAASSSASPLRVSSTVNTPSTPSTPTDTSSETSRRSSTPIKLLTPYCKNWRLCIKVVSVGEVRHSRGMNVFSFHAADSSGAEIRVSAFKELAERMAAFISNGKMYYISRASIRPLSRRFCSSQVDMEVILSQDSEIVECTDQPQITSPKLHFKFVRINSIVNFVDSEVDVIGVVQEIGEVKQLTGRSGDTLFKRDIVIVDDSERSITVTLWGERAKNFRRTSSAPIFVAKGLVARSFHGTMSLSLVASSKVALDPDLPEVLSLSRWYSANSARNFTCVSLEPLRSFNEHRWIGNVRSTPTTQYFSIVATVLHVNVENAVYKGCANEGCRKKLIETDNGLKCLKCGNLTDNYRYFYTLLVEVCDFTGAHFVNVFDDSAEKMLGEPADEVAKIRKYNFDEYCDRLKKLLFMRYIFRIAAKLQEGNVAGQSPEHQANSARITGGRRLPPRMRWSVLDLIPLDYDMYIPFLNRCIEKFSAK